jgi:hypothetical protein
VCVLAWPSTAVQAAVARCCCSQPPS